MRFTPTWNNGFWKVLDRHFWKDVGVHGTLREANEQADALNARGAL